MKMRTGLLVALIVGAVVGVFVAGSLAPPALSRADDRSAGGPHYTVVDTEGHNLIVTDNQTNTLYFYTIDKEEKVGSELKLRGQIDLNQVGKPTIKPRHAGAEK